LQWVVVVVLAAAVLVPAGSAAAQAPPTNWIAPPAPLDWHDPNNWDFGVPLPIQDAFVDIPFAHAVVGMLGPTIADANALSIGIFAPSTVEVWFGSTLDANAVYVGQLGNLVFGDDWLHDGLLSVQGLMMMQGNNLILDDGGQGEFLGGWLPDANDLVVAHHTVADFTQVDASISAMNLTVAMGAGSAGTYQLTDGQLTVGNDLIVGNGGDGQFVQNRGDVSAVVAVIGQQAGADGYYELNDGNMDVGVGAGAPLAMGPWSPGLWVAADGNGVFRQNGGVVQALNVGIALTPNSTGLYEMFGGALQATSMMAPPGEGPLMPSVIGGITVASDGQGTFRQYGGDVLAEIAAVGLEANSVGLYEMLDGNLTVSGEMYVGGESAAGMGMMLMPGTLAVGVEGDGTFVQEAGYVSADAVAVAMEANSVGVYEMNGGVLSIGGAIPVGEAPAGEATYGGLSVGVDGDGAFLQSGGAVIANVVIVGENPGSIGVVEISDGNMTIGSGGGALPGEAPAAYESQDLWVGYDGTGTVTQLGGDVTTEGLHLGTYMNGDGTYDLYGGALYADWIEFGDGNGRFVLDGGAVQSSGEWPIWIEYGYGAGMIRVERGVLDADYLGVWSYGDNAFIQNGGTVTTPSLWVGACWGEGGVSAVYEMNGGDLMVCGMGREGPMGIAEGYDLVIQSEGLFDQTDGNVLVCDGSVYIGDVSWMDGLAEYYMSGGTLTVLREGYDGGGDPWWTPPPRGYIFIGGYTDWTSGTLDFSGGEIWASRLFIGPTAQFMEYYMEGEPTENGEDPFEIPGYGQMYIAGAFMHLDGDGEAGDPPSLIGGLLSGYGTIVSGGPIRVLQSGIVVAR